MRKKIMLFACIILVVLTLLYNLNYVPVVKNSSSDIDIQPKLVSIDIDEDDNIMLDVELKNNSNKSIYNVEILTEAPDENYVKNYGNDICAVKDEVEPGDSFYLRSVYAVKDDEDPNSFSGYEVNLSNNYLIFLMLYLFVVVALLRVLIKDKTKKCIYASLIFVVVFALSIVLCILGRQTGIKVKNTDIIYNYEDTVDVNIAGRDEQIKVIVNYTMNSLDNLLDRNKNGTRDIDETNDLKRDTDGDSLPDFFELYLCGTNPYMLDTNAAGTGDVNFDTDYDGLSNLQEYELGTNPANPDTDYDGLSDIEELDLGADPLVYDTDKDGMGDGFELEQGYDPLVMDGVIEITKELTSDDKNPSNRIKASVKVKIDPKNAESLDIETYETMLVNENMPGYIGSAFNFSLYGEFEESTINFELDDVWFSRKEYDPCIYYFNEDTQLLEELETQIDGNTVSASVSHFSVYVVLNRKEVNKWLYEDLFIQDTKEVVEEGYVSFVLDLSHSMEETDPDNQTKELVATFVNSLKETNAKVNLVTFTAKGKLQCDFTNDYARFLDIPNNIVRDTGKEPDSGTNIQNGLIASMDSFDESSGRKYIVLVTDGDILRNTLNEELVINKAKDKGVSIYCVDVGHVNSKLLGYLCSHTGGRYYLANRLVAVGELSEKFKNVEKDILESQDTIGDKLTNYEKSLIESGVLKTGTGVSLFEGVNFSPWRYDEDADGDGLLNGDEVSIEVVNDHIYIRLNSDPFKADTDADGVKDLYDTAPFTYGIRNGKIGTMYLVGHPTGMNSSGSGGIDTGHSWLLLQSDCDIVLDSPNFKEGYYKVIIDRYARAVTSHNMYPYKLGKLSYASFGYYPEGNRGKWENNGKTPWPDNITKEEVGKILAEQNKIISLQHCKEEQKKNPKKSLEEIEEELAKEADKLGDVIYSDFRINQEFKNSIGNPHYYEGAVAISFDITAKELRRFMEYVETAPPYSMGKYNCTNFAVEAWNTMWQDDTHRVSYSPVSFGYPSSLCRDIEERVNVIIHISDRMFNWWYEMQPLVSYDAEGNVINNVPFFQ